MSRRTNIIGPVHENSNGSYVRLENGWQICWGVTDSHAINQPSGSWERTNTQGHTFPAPFLPGEVVMVGSPQLTGGNPGGHYVQPSGSGESFNFRLYSGGGGSAALAFVAVGKWK